MRSHGALIFGLMLMSTVASAARPTAEKSPGTGVQRVEIASTHLSGVQHRVGPTGFRGDPTTSIHFGGILPGRLASAPSPTITIKITTADGRLAELQTTLPRVPSVRAGNPFSAPRSGYHLAVHVRDALRDAARTNPDLSFETRLVAPPGFGNGSLIFY